MSTSRLPWNFDQGDIRDVPAARCYIQWKRKRCRAITSNKKHQCNIQDVFGTVCIYRDPALCLYFLCSGHFWASSFGQWVCSYQPITALAGPYKNVVTRYQIVSMHPRGGCSQGGRANFEFCVYKLRLPNPTHSALKAVGQSMHMSERDITAVVIMCISSTYHACVFQKENRY